MSHVSPERPRGAAINSPKEQMKQIPLSDNSRRLGSVSSLHKGIRLFTQDRRVQRTPEVLNLIDEQACLLVVIFVPTILGRAMISSWRAAR